MTRDHFTSCLPYFVSQASYIFCNSEAENGNFCSLRRSPASRPRWFFTRRAGFFGNQSFETQNSKNDLTVLRSFALVPGPTPQDARNSRTSTGPHWSSMTNPLLSEYFFSFPNSKR